MSVLTNSQSIDLELSSSQYLSITDASQTGLDVTGDITLEAWVQVESALSGANEYRTIVGKWDGTGDNRSYILQYRRDSSNNRIRFFGSADGSTTFDTLYPVTLEAGSWYHLAVTRASTSGETKLYINGVNVKTETLSAGSGLYNGGSDFFVGAQGGSQGYWDGLIDEVRVFNDVRTPTEIANNWRCGIDSSTANLQAYYTFNGGNANDATSNGNDLTENNSPTYSTTVPFGNGNENTNVTDIARASSQYWSITDASQTGLDITGDLTIEAWIKLDASPGNGENYPFVSKFGASGQYSYSFRLQDNASVESIRLFISSSGLSGGDLDTYVIDHTLLSGVWWHLAVVWDASESSAEFFVNGVSIGTDTGSQTSIFNSTSAFTIGKQAGASEYFDGAVEEVRIYDDLRTQAEILDNMLTEIDGSTTNLQGYWRFNATGDDETSNNNDLTNNNSATFSSGVPFTGPSTGNAIFFAANF